MDHKSTGNIGDGNGVDFSTHLEAADSKVSSPSSSSQDKKGDDMKEDNFVGGGSDNNEYRSNTTNDKGEQKTFNKNHPISEFLRLQKGMIDSGISQEEFAARYDKFCEENGYENDGSFANQQLGKGEGKDSSDSGGSSSKGNIYTCFNICICMYIHVLKCSSLLVTSMKICRWNFQAVRQSQDNCSEIYHFKRVRIRRTFFYSWHYGCSRWS